MMRRKSVLLITSLLATLAFASPASASTTSVTAKASVIPTSTAQMSCNSSSCFSAGAGNDAVVKVVLPTRFTTVTNVSITLNFPTIDALDPCDVINIAVEGAGGATGLVLPCDSALGLTTRTFTLPNIGPPFLDMLAQFADGRARLDIWMGFGSATISSATVTVTGTR